MNFLTEAEIFSDRIELAGYVTFFGAALFLPVFFGMMFFYAPVRALPGPTRLGVFAGLIVVSSLGYLLTRLKNWARLLLLTFYVGVGLYALIAVRDRSAWFWAPAVWSFFSVWVLSHPAAIARFRPLRPRESRLADGLAPFTLGLTALIFFCAFTFYTGLESWTLSWDQTMTDAEAYSWAVHVLGALGLALLAACVRRLWVWARWLAVLVLLSLAGALLPETFSTRSYGVYWLALGKMSYFAGFAAYLAFSARVQRAFTRPAPAAPPTS